MSLLNRSAGLFLSVFSCCPVFAQTMSVNTSWLPITDAEMAMKKPLVDKNAGVEAIFWHVHVVDEVSNTELRRALYHYVRLKVFSEEGKTKAATIDIPYFGKSSILYIAGRTIKADGSIVELTKDAIHDRDMFRGPRRIRQSAKSFSMPGVEPGAIVEYRWKEVRWDPNSLYLRLQFQREFPVQRVTYYVKPLSREYTPNGMRIWPFNCNPSPVKLENNGFNSTFLENVPAFREEPMMPGEPNVRPWALIYYPDSTKKDPDKYWAEIGKRYYQFLKQALKLNDELKQVAATAVKGAANDEERVACLIRYVRKNFRGLYDSNVTDAERSKVLKQSKERLRTSVEVFKSGIGTPDELNTLFAALASEVDLEARPAMVANREGLAFDPVLAEKYFLESIDMSVRIGDEWKLYDVSARHLPSNMLSWREEAVSALITDPKKPVFIQTKASPPEASLSTRTGRFKLDGEGTLEGDVIESHQGHTALDHRLEMDGQSEEVRQEHLKDRITKLFPQSEVSDMKLENSENPEEPLHIKYHVKIPGYAQRTGKRIFFQPLYFERGVPPLFSAGDRQFEIWFPHAWKEVDQVAIELPEGFVLDNAENAGGIAFGKPGSYALNMAVRANRLLECTREFVFGNNSLLLFPRDAYPSLKKLFEEVNRRDAQTISLKQAGSPPAGQ
jgi:hypothetical protein